MKMETNRYDYNTTVQWTPQQNQFYEGGYVTPQARQQQLPRPQNPRTPQSAVGQKPRAPEKMPKARALALADTVKKWLVVASIVGFGTFSGLAALHQVGTTASQSTKTSSGSSTTSTSSSSSQNSNSFLNQGGNNLGSSTSSSTSASGSSVS
jgi:hypothetical protein